MIPTVAMTLVHNTPGLLRDTHKQISPLFAVDNGSDKPLKRATYRLPKNRYFTGGWNDAMWRINQDMSQIGRSGFEWAWMLNSDVQGVSYEMMEQLAEYVSFAPKAAIISPTFNSPHPHMQPLIGSKGLRQVKWIDWTAPLVDIEVFNEICGFDERFYGYGADLDICKRLEKLGYEFYVVDDLTFHHLGSVTVFKNGDTLQNDVGHMNCVLKEKYGVDSWIQMFP